MEERFLTVAEAAKILKLSESTIHRLTRDGKIPAFKVGRSVRLKESDLINWIDSNPKTQKGIEHGNA